VACVSQCGVRECSECSVACVSAVWCGVRESGEGGVYFFG
jgi:hypothetical protein